MSNKKERVTMAILVTGGAGFIGSHTVVELIQAEKRSLLSITFPIPNRKF